MQDLAGAERRPLEVEDSVKDVTDLTESAEGMKCGEALVGRSVAHGCPDDPWGDGVDPDPSRGVLDRQRAGRGCQSALRQGHERRRPLAAGVVEDAGCDVDDVSAA